MTAGALSLPMARKWLYSLAMAIPLYALTSGSLWAEAFDQKRESLRQSVVFLRAIFSNGTSQFGTGFYIDGKQHIVTARHVVTSEVVVDGKKLATYPDTVAVSLGSPNGPMYYVDRNSMNVSDHNDIAILQSDVAQLAFQPLPLCAQFAPRRGDTIRIAGFPNGSRLSEQTGIFDTAIGKMWHLQSKFARGVSGGPAINADNIVVGIYIGSYDGVASSNTDVILPISELVESVLKAYDVSLICPKFQEVLFAAGRSAVSIEGSAILKLTPLPAKQYLHTALQRHIYTGYPASGASEDILIGSLRFVHASMKSTAPGNPSLNIGQLYGAFCKKGKPGPVAVINRPFGPGAIAIAPKYLGTPNIPLDGEEIILGAVGSSELPSTWVCLTPIIQQPLVSSHEQVPPPGTVHSIDAESRGCNQGCR